MSDKIQHDPEAFMLAPASAQAHPSPKPFRDVVTPRRDGGIDIEIDHPRGSLRWELPGDRALELRDAIAVAARRETSEDNPMANTEDLCKRLRTYFEPDEHDEDHDAIRELMIEAADRLDALSDSARVDWLQAEPWRLIDVFGQRRHHGSVRATIDQLRKTTTPAPEGTGVNNPDASSAPSAD